MTTRMHFSDFSRVGKGYMFLNSVRCYIEVWHSVVWQEDRLKIFYPKNMSYSYVAGKNITKWHCENAYMWCKLPYKACIDTAISVVIAETDLRFFEESRKWLTKEEREVAHMVATDSIGILDAEQLLNCDVCDMPQAFHEEVSRFRNEYEAYLNRREQEDREMAEKLNTPEGLAYMLRIARRYGERQPAVSFINQIIFDLTELWDK